MTSPEHHEDGGYVNAPRPPEPYDPPLRPEDDGDWRPGETEADRDARLAAAAAPDPGAESDLAAKWAEQQAGQADDEDAARGLD
jgi:hypothetical protein